MSCFCSHSPDLKTDIVCQEKRIKEEVRSLQRHYHQQPPLTPLAKWACHQFTLRVRLTLCTDDQNTYVYDMRYQNGRYTICNKHRNETGSIHILKCIVLTLCEQLPNGILVVGQGTCVEKVALVVS